MLMEEVRRVIIKFVHIRDMQNSFAVRTTESFSLLVIKGPAV